MKTEPKTYSIREVKAKMEKYLDASSERLRSRLRTAWKKRQGAKLKVYDRPKL